MKIIETKVYSFNELSEEAKEKAIENQRSNEYYLDYDWYEFVIENWTEKLNDIGFEDIKIYFSGFWSQGDGAMFEYLGINNKLLFEWVDGLKLTPLRNKIAKEILYASAKGNQCGMYYHSKSCKHVINLETQYGSMYGTNIYDWINEHYMDFEDFIENIYDNVCNEIYRDLEKEYDWLMSNEVIAEHIEANEYEFKEDGTRF